MCSWLGLEDRALSAAKATRHLWGETACCVRACVRVCVCVLWVWQAHCLMDGSKSTPLCALFAANFELIGGDCLGVNRRVAFPSRLLQTRQSWIDKVWMHNDACCWRLVACMLQTPGLCARQYQKTCAHQRIGIMGNHGELWGIMGNYGELWGIMGMGFCCELWGIMGKYRDVCATQVRKTFIYTASCQTATGGRTTPFITKFKHPK